MQQFRYVRLYADGEGESHFEDVTAAMEPMDFAPPAPPLNVASLGGASELSLVGGGSDWGGTTVHPSPTRQVLCYLAGRVEVTASDGETREFGPGSLMLLEDTSGKGHATRVLTDEVVVAAVRLAAE